MDFILIIVSIISMVTAVLSVVLAYRFLAKQSIKDIEPNLARIEAAEPIDARAQMLKTLMLELKHVAGESKPTMGKPDFLVSYLVSESKGASNWPDIASKPFRFQNPIKKPSSKTALVQSMCQPEAIDPVSDLLEEMRIGSACTGTSGQRGPKLD